MLNTSETIIIFGEITKQYWVTHVEQKHILGISLLDKVKLLLLFHRTTRFFLARRFLPLIVRLPGLIIRRLHSTDVLLRNDRMVNHWSWIVSAYDASCSLLSCQRSSPGLIDELVGKLGKLGKILPNVGSAWICLLSKCNW